MNYLLKTTIACALAGIFGASAKAANLTIKVTIPRIDATEYHRPYVAVWLESADKRTQRDIAVWYERESVKDEGKKYLKDLRQWWRISGRGQGIPADGISGATRAAGVHAIRIDDTTLAELPAGKYALAVEAVREKGGRELVRLPLDWPPERPTANSGQGLHELGKVSVESTP